MIVLGEKKEALNIIHLIYGPETEFQLDMTGQCVLDITEYCKQNTENTILVINRCRSEEEVVKTLSKIDSFTNIKKDEKSLNNNNDEQQIIFKKHKCPICLSDNGIFKNGIIYPCKSCQIIENGLKEFNISNKNQKMSVEKHIIELIQNNPHEFQSFLQKIYLNKKRKEKINE